MRPPTHYLTHAAAAYSCTAVTARFGSRATGDAGIIGYPFRLIARYAQGSYAWCRVIPLGNADRLSAPRLPAALSGGYGARASTRSSMI